MTQETGLLLGSYVGKVLKVHADDRGISWGKYLRIRVEVDITKALLRGTFLNVEGKKCWVPFKYERLPSICFKCGTIKHNHLACLSATSRGGSQQYGAWLRAPATKDSDLQLKKYGEAADPEGQVHDQSWRRETEGREDLQGGSPAITDGCQERNLASDRLDCKIVDRSDIQGAERLTRQGNFPRQVGTQKLAGKGVPPLNPPNVPHEKLERGLDEQTRPTGIAHTPLTAKEAVQHGITAPPRSLRFISWNSRGLGNPLGVRVLRDLTRREDPTILFLQETRLSVTRMEKIKYILGFPNCLAVSNDRGGGGIALLWKNSIDLKITQYSKSHIHAEIKLQREGEAVWYLTGVYGHPEAARRHDTWSLIKSLMVPVGCAWLVMGDFNEILHMGEKRGGRSRPEWQMEDFSDMLVECRLLDLGFCGPQFTWWNGRQEEHSVSERLDRFCANQEWSSKFAMWHVVHLPIAYSDHLAVILKPQVDPNLSSRGPGFRFEAMWTETEGCKQVVSSTWNLEGGDKDISSLMKKIKGCGERLQ
ncbi:hypothetical protein I3760_13G120100 [Carya illinoinensis]|nr:hypothetical protein I3760_13G120100 [Carya illinoinensis]